LITFQSRKNYITVGCHVIVYLKCIKIQKQNWNLCSKILAFFSEPKILFSLSSSPISNFASFAKLCSLACHSISTEIKSWARLNAKFLSNPKSEQITCVHYLQFVDFDEWLDNTNAPWWMRRYIHPAWDPPSLSLLLHFSHSQNFIMKQRYGGKWFCPPNENETKDILFRAYRLLLSGEIFGIAWVRWMSGLVTERGSNVFARIGHILGLTNR
jgi:hypothetical protein